MFLFTLAASLLLATLLATPFFLLWMGVRQAKWWREARLHRDDERVPLPGPRTPPVHVWHFRHQ